MLQALWQHALALDVQFLEPVFLLELVVESGRCVGAIGWQIDTGETVISTGPVVLATGGLRPIYETTTNAAIGTGDGMVAALD